MQETNVFIRLDWDSHYFGYRIGKIFLDRITSDSLAGIVEEACTQNVDVLEAFSAIEDEESISSLQKNDFNFSGLKIFLESRSHSSKNIQNVEGPCLEQACARDIGELVSAFHGIFSSSRYYSYACLDSRQVDALYDIWIKNSVEATFDDVCLFIRRENKPAGLCTLKFLEGKARIGLFGVNPRFQGQGVGSALIVQVVDWLHSKSVDVISVATQGKNIAAIRLYEANGFKTTSLEMCFYKKV